MASDSSPLFLTTHTLPTFLTYILNYDAPQTTLIICSSQSAFLQELHSSLSEDSFLYKPTLSLLANSRTINLSYVPTLPHLRAYLSVYKSPPQDVLRSDNPGMKMPMLAIINLVGLHENTTSFAAQGIGLTIASAIEAAAREKMKLLVVECAECGERVWAKELPVLNGSNDRFVGRTIELGKIFARWCSYGGIVGEDEDEMKEDQEIVENTIDIG